MSIVFASAPNKRSALSQALYQFSNITADPYYPYTTLLLPGNGTNGAQNNTFLDGSTNNFTITRNGNTTQGTFSPFSQTGWGNYFGGSSNLSAAYNSAFDVGSSDFTVEAWIFTGDSSSNYPSIIGRWQGGALCWDFRPRSVDVGNYLVFLYSTNGSNITFINSNFVVTDNAWHHVVAVRSGSNFALFVDGSRKATANVSGVTIFNSSSVPLYVGYDQGGNTYFNGYISNARFVNGRAVYDPTLTTLIVPTSPLGATSGGANPPTTGQTKLLTCQSNRFLDNGQGNTGNTGFPITVTGSPSVQAFSPFNPTSSWSAATNGGSGYFDGTGDYLTVPQSAGALDLGSGQFSLEFWWYPTSAATGQYPFIGESTGNWYVGYESSNIVLGRRATTADVSTTGFTLVANTWQHIVFTRQSTSTNDTRIFINGVLRGIGTTSQNYTITSTLSIGGVAGGYVTGYLSSINLVKGSVPAAYQTSSTTTGTQIFTPPTSPSTSVTGTQLLLNFTNAGIYDATSKNDLETVGNAQISTAQSKWGGSSMYFDGTSDYLVFPSSNLFTLGDSSANFTIETWVYSTGTPGTDAVIAGTWQNSTSAYANRWLLSLRTSGTAIYWWDSTGSPGITYTGISTGQWVYIAVVRSGGTITLYVNGVSRGTQTTNQAYTTQDVLRVGGGISGTSDFPGYIQDLRITKGYARTITASPTAAFPTL